MQSAKSQRYPAGHFSGFRWRASACSRACCWRLPRHFSRFSRTTAVAIFALLAWNLLGHHTVNYADTYLYVGFPAGVVALLIALPLFGTLWMRAKLRR